MKYKLLVISLLCLALGSSPVHASTLYWSANGTSLGGAGTWDTTNQRWGTSTSGPFTTVWNNANSDNATLYYNIGGGSVVIGAAITMNGTFTFDQTTGTYASYTVNGVSTMTFSVGSTLSCNNVSGSCLAVGSFNSPHAADRKS